MQPHTWQPTRLPHPWGSPGKNTGVGCHFLLQCIKVKVKSLSRVRLFATSWTAAYQAPPSMGFSRQEYWSGLPFSLQSRPILYNPMDCSPAGSSAHGILQTRIWSGLSYPSPGDLPDPRIKPEYFPSPALMGRFLRLAPPTYTLLSSPTEVDIIR